MAIMAAAIGIVTLLTMPRAEDPQIYPPSYNVIVIYPGTSPEDMQQLVAKPIEDLLFELDDVDKLFSTIEDGLAIVSVDFTYGVDVDDKYQEVVREINSLSQDLPEGILDIEIRKVDPSDVKILQTALISETMDYATMEDYADDLVEELEQLPMLKEIDISGVSPQVVNIDLDLQRLAKYNIPLDIVIASLQSEDINIPGGLVNAGNKSYNIKSSGKFIDIEDISNTVVFSFDNALVHLREVADISLKNVGQTHITRLNGQRCILVNAAMKEGANIAQAQSSYIPVLENYETKLPPSLKMSTPFDQGDNVARRLNGLRFDFTLAICLVLLTLLPLGFRASFVVMIAIPLSLALGLVGLNYFGISLNQLSIVGLVVALGLLVDDSIVVVENIERWIREGYSRTDAAIKATKQIFTAVIGTTATLVISFLPLVFLPGGAGEFVRGLPLAVITSVVASSIVALTVVPFVSSRILKDQTNSEGNIVMRMLKRAINATYSKLVKVSLRFPIMTLLVGFSIFGFSLTLFPVIGFKLFPSSEKPIFLIDIDMPDQSSILHSNKVAKMIEDSLATEELIANYTTNVGKGNPTIYYNVAQKREQGDFAQVFVQLHEDTPPLEKTALIEHLRKRFKNFPFASIKIEDFVQGPPITSPIEIRVFGNKEEQLSKVAADIEGLLNETEGSVYVNNDMALPQTDIKVNINRARAQSLGVATAVIDQTIRLAVAGLVVGTYTDKENEDYNILLSATDEEYPKLDALQSVYVNNRNGTPIALDQFTSLNFESSAKSVNRFNKKRYAKITANTDNGVLANDVLDKLLPKLDAYEFPAGYYYKLGGEAESEGDAFGGNFIIVVILSIFLFLAVLILQFKTFKGTIIVLSVIPLGVVGGVSMLFLTGNPMSFVAIIGFIGLAGIEVKNSILLVDFTNQLREEGTPLNEAIEKAGELRFLPVLLTAVTAIGGLLPLAISANPLISPLALVLIGGLISSTFLSRIITPVLYKVLPPTVEVK